ncbi:MAG: hypothetical protein ACXACB_14590 [Promethearchaeota archaeon]
MKSSFHGTTWTNNYWNMPDNNSLKITLASIPSPLTGNSSNEVMRE